jgi:hypothetical protein
MFNSSERSPVGLQKEEASMASQGELQDKYNIVESLVVDVIASTNGAAASAASAAVDSAVRRARQKNKILPSMGSGLVYAALDVSKEAYLHFVYLQYIAIEKVFSAILIYFTLFLPSPQEVAFDIASLPEVSTANAAIMRQITEDMLQQKNNPPASTPFQTGGAPPASSVQSIRGEQVPPNPESLESAGRVPSAEVPSATTEHVPSLSDAAQFHPSSVMTTIHQAGSDAATSSAMDEELESTAGTSADQIATATASAHRIMEPVRQLIAETCSPEQHDPECDVIRRNLRLKKPKSGDMRIAREVDFDRCVSPRPQTPSSSPSSPSSPRVGKLGTPRVRGACLEFGLDATGRKPIKVEPMYQHMDQYSPMTPRGGNGGSGTGGTGRIVTLKGDYAPGYISPRQSNSERGHRRRWRTTSGTGSGGGGFSGASSPRSLSQGGSPRGGAGLQVGGMNVCEAGAPPGLLPTARVEGSKESMEGGFGGISGGGERVGDPAPGWFDPIHDEEFGQSGSTSMLPEVNDICSQLQSSGI